MALTGSIEAPLPEGSRIGCFKEETKQQSKHFKFSMKIAFALCTLVRLALIFNIVPSWLSRLVNSPAIESALVNPIYTVKHLREGMFLLDMSRGTVESAYSVGLAFRLPPLVLAAFQLFLAERPRYVTGLVILAVDIIISFCLYDICRRVLLESDERVCREQRLESQMHERLRPKRAWFFGIGFSSEFPPHKELQEENSSEPQTNAAEEIQKKIVDKVSSPSIAVVKISGMSQLCCLLYFCNPVCILASSGIHAQSLQSIFYLLPLLALREVLPLGKPWQPSGHIVNVPISAFYLALASYLELYHIVYLIPIVLLVAKSCGDKKRAMKGQTN